MELSFKYNDGGRSQYFKGYAGDCVTRAITIATGLDYKEVYDNIKDLLNHTPRNGLTKQETRDIMEWYGFSWVPCMRGGSGITTHLRANEIPMNKTIICQCSKHVVAVVDGVINDIFNCSRGGTRAVYGYWQLD